MRADEILKIMVVCIGVNQIFKVGRRNHVLKVGVHQILKVGVNKIFKVWGSKPDIKSEGRVNRILKMKAG